ncbi:unnamed protein product [Cuscuta epithymum]|nr:unnamed protein product [Cuscuta epithymum]CAH9145105.1 unnamed protein product [Cuscuta epithymum]
MLTSQINNVNSTGGPQAVNSNGQAADQSKGAETHDGSRGDNSEPPSDHTRIWSDLSGSGRNQIINEQQEIQRGVGCNISGVGAAAGNVLSGANNFRNEETDHTNETQGRRESTRHASQYHPNNWIDAGEEDDDEDDEDPEFVVEATPPHH